MMEATEAQLEQSYRLCVRVCVRVFVRVCTLCGNPAHTHHPDYRYLTSGLQLEELESSFCCRVSDVQWP